MEQACRTITLTLQTDLGGRGLLSGPVEDQTRELLARLAHVERAILLTGFPVRRFDGKVVGETDGPPGVANIAWALEAQGIQVIALTDETCLPQLKAAMAARGCHGQPAAIPESAPQAFLKQLLNDFQPTHLITLERPGKARDGHFYNMRGIAIDSLLTDTDSILEEARRRGAQIISVGDGGNELGMGALRPLIEERVPHGDLICANAAADLALVSGVSNWWGWGIAAYCSLISGKNLLPSPETERAILQAIIAAGGADGCTGLMEESVDGLPLDVHISLLKKLHRIVTHHLPV